ncbi:hypothetical protein PP180_15990 [Muricauda sp. SK9]|uniref:hypothetical protein n=1 Tax=Flavobacteriaceae TaxID=49546 RepID=UPI00234B4D56|nr:hypothetical protein [Muricauda sp. SK9]MDC6386882.1 hypothetical protein [Muricauda sp. SK9]
MGRLQECFGQDLTDAEAGLTDGVFGLMGLGYRFKVKGTGVKVQIPIIEASKNPICNNQNSTREYLNHFHSEQSEESPTGAKDSSNTPRFQNDKQRQ